MGDRAPWLRDSITGSKRHLSTAQQTSPCVLTMGPSEKVIWKADSGHLFPSTPGLQESGKDNDGNKRKSRCVSLAFKFHFRDARQMCEKAMATHSNTFAWKIPWKGSLVGCSPWGCEESDTTEQATSLSLFTFMHWRRKWQPTPVFLLGESKGQGSLVSCHLWGRTESDTTEQLNRSSSSSSSSSR